MSFEWDEAKNRANAEKHGFSFEVAAQIFGGPILRKIDDRADYGEVRYIAIGELPLGVALTVVYTGRSDNIRIISARRASKDEREIYGKKIHRS